MKEITVQDIINSNKELDRLVRYTERNMDDVALRSVTLGISAARKAIQEASKRFKASTVSELLENETVAYGENLHASINKLEEEIDELSEEIASLETQLEEVDDDDDEWLRGDIESDLQWKNEQLDEAITELEKKQLELGSLG